MCKNIIFILKYHRHKLLDIIYKFLIRNLKGGGHLNKLGGNKIKLKWIFRIDLAEDRDQCRALVNTVMDLLVPYKVKNFGDG
jgi:hypothetical protein